MADGGGTDVAFRMVAEPGWYRLGGSGWVRVGDAKAEAEIAAGDGWDLVYILLTPPAMEPLW